jgi:hypothetical protein
MYIRVAARSPSLSIVVLRITNSKNEKSAIALAMKSPTATGPWSRKGSPTRLSIVTSASGRKRSASSGHARRVTTSAYADCRRRSAT